MSDINTAPLLKTLNRLYTQEQYQEAIDILLESKASFSPGLFHFNLGTLYSKKQDYPVGRYHLEKALKEGYTSLDLYKNLNTTIKFLQSEGVRENPTAWEVTLSRVTTLPTSGFLSFTLIIMTLFFLGLWKKWWRGKIAIIIFAGLAFLPMGLHFYVNSKYQVAISLKETLVREGASEIFEQSVMAPGGTKLLVLKSKNKWFYIAYPEDYRGWTTSESLGFL